MAPLFQILFNEHMIHSEFGAAQDPEALYWLPALIWSSHWIQVTLRIGNKWIKLRPEGTMLRQPHLQIIAARKSTRMCSVVPQYTKDHLKSIIFLPPDWSVNDTTQMILGIMVHRQRVTSSSLGWCPPPKNPNKLLPTSSEIQTQCDAQSIPQYLITIVPEVHGKYHSGQKFELN